LFSIADEDVGAPAMQRHLRRPHNHPERPPSFVLKPDDTRITEEGSTLDVVELEGNMGTPTSRRHVFFQLPTRTSALPKCNAIYVGRTIILKDRRPSYSSRTILKLLKKASPWMSSN